MSPTSRARGWIFPTVFTAVGVAVLLGLGTWQVERLHWKEALIAQRQARLAEPATDLPEGGDPSALEYRHVRFAGRFLHDREMYLAPRTLNGEPAIVVLGPDGVDSVYFLTVEDGRITAVHSIRNPEKLTAV